MKKLLALTLAFAMLSATLVGCGDHDHEEDVHDDVVVEQKDDQTSKEKMVITYVTSPLNVPSIVEKDQKIFSQVFEAFEVEYAEITSGADQTQALASGDVQILNAVGATSVILSAANGADIKVASMYSRGAAAFQMYTRDDSIVSAADLEGKTIAGPAGTNLYELLIAYLDTAGLTLDDVNFVNLGIGESKTALDTGDVDVALLAGATAYIAETEGARIVTTGEDLIGALIAVAVTNKYSETNGEEVVSFLNAQQIIADYMDENLDQALQAAAVELDLDIEAIESMYALYDFNTEITQQDKEMFQKTADFMYEADMIEAPFDTSVLFFD